MKTSLSLLSLLLLFGACGSDDGDPQGGWALNTIAPEGSYVSLSANSPNPTLVYITSGKLRFAEAPAMTPEYLYQEYVVRLATAASRDTQGELHAAFVDNSNKLRYLYKEAPSDTVWKTLEVDTLTSAPTALCMRHGQDKVFIAYLAPGKVKAAIIEAGQPSVVDVDNYSNITAEIGVGCDLDSKGIFHISYGMSTELRHATVSAGVATPETITKGKLGTGLVSSLAIDAQDRVHIAYRHRDSSNNTLQGSARYAYHDGTSWQLSTIDTAKDTGAAIRLALAADGTLHVVYVEEPRSEIIYATRKADGSFERSVVIPQNKNMASLDIALTLDAKGKPVLAIAKEGIHIASP